MLEVSTPVLSGSGNTDVNIESFSTHYAGPMLAGSAVRWLRTSPEFALKRLLAEGSGDIFEIGPVFRNGEFGPRHNPEFTMLEWYRLGFDHHDLMHEVGELITDLAKAFGRRLDPIAKLSYCEFYAQHLNLDISIATLDELFSPLQEYGIEPEGLSRDDLLDLLRTHCIEPRMSHHQAMFLYDFPASQAALARIRQENFPVAERFELYLGKVEMANGYHELTDAVELRNRFLNDQHNRERRGMAVPKLDENLLQALPGMPACAGVALGVERLHLWLAGKLDLSSVMPIRFDLA